MLVFVVLVVMLMVMVMKVPMLMMVRSAFVFVLMMLMLIGGDDGDVDGVDVNGDSGDVGAQSNGQETAIQLLFQLHRSQGQTIEDKRKIINTVFVFVFHGSR